MSEVCQRITLCKAAEVEVGNSVRVEKDSRVLPVCILGGEFHVTDDACTHGPGSLSESCITGDVVECDFHKSASGGLNRRAPTIQVLRSKTLKA